MASSNLDETTLLSTLDKLSDGLDKMLDELSHLIYTMSRQGQATEHPLALYRALVESANQAKTLRSQEIEALYIGRSETRARSGNAGREQA
jgi:hypothetical protein